MKIMKNNFKNQKKWKKYFLKKSTQLQWRHNLSNNKKTYKKIYYNNNIINYNKNKKFT